MARYTAGGRRKGLPGLPRRVKWLLLVLLVLATAAVLAVRHIYYLDLRPVSGVLQPQIFTVKSGSGVKEIGDNLAAAHLIRSAWAFELYVHSKEFSDKIQAGTYAVAPGDSTPQIVSILTKGRVSTQLVTIIPGRRIDQVRADLINDGFAPADVNAALDNTAQYADLPVMVFKPPNINTLEGLLWPDSWYKDADTPPSQIIRESLTAMGQHLTPDVQAAFTSEGLANTYQGLILSSIIIQEVNKPSDQTQVAQVFIARLKTNSTLGSDVTTRYGAIEAGHAPDLTYDSPYNTHLHPGLPPTPISTINTSSLYAATHPANTNWLYFVAGDNGTTYFATNLQDHNAQVQQYCHKLCQQ